MGTSVKAPPPRDYYKETAGTLQAQVDLAPELYAAEAKWQPKYAELNLQVLETMLNGSAGQRGALDIYTKDLMPGLAEASSASARVQREADITDVEDLAPRFREALDAANPDQAALMKALNESALGQVGAGAGLDPDLQRQVSQSARGAQAARGFGYGMNDAAQEALFSGQAGEQLRRGREGFALNVSGMNNASRVDPALAILGRQGVSLNSAAQMAGQYTQAPGSQFSPESAYAQDLYNTNYNAEAAANIASANAKSAMIGAGIGAVGKIGGGMATGGTGFFAP
tara:strand:+ start:133 stop:987 length:855 start_codon:yes stop_codon:yes gene_type:complete